MRLADMRYLQDIDSEEATFVVPRQERDRVLQEYHDRDLAAHYAVDRTYRRIAQRYVWIGMKKYITDYLQNCGDCQSKWVELFALLRATAEECTRVLIDQVFLRFELPLRIVNDNGVQFVSHETSSIRFDMNTVVSESTDYSAVYLTFAWELRTLDDIAHDFRTIVESETFVPLITSHPPPLSRVLWKPMKPPKKRHKAYADSKEY
ncbi:hypothetical protein ILUMI_22218 [Ignelater luminosus]|uniref:RNA-directed DNA polymerase n=1 Tax=Ignelater luminosus TaxID=2038154 RepID=A0A8K0CHJ1_IGNLU|nr:hypothetical protein ILUMI_22218 [Ignelater luminosus]